MTMGGISVERAAELDALATRDEESVLPNRSIRLGVAGLVFHPDGERILFGERKKPPVGIWVIPGGGLKHGEHPRRTVERELLEETGLHVVAGRLFNVYAFPSEPNPEEWRVLIVYVCGVSSNPLPRAADDLKRVTWANQDTVKAMIGDGFIKGVNVEIMQDLEWWVPKNVSTDEER